nr:photosystem II phosphoprotein [Helleborus thibetanus]
MRVVLDLVVQNKLI